MTTEEIYDYCAAQAGETWHRWFAWRPVWISEGERAHRPAWLVWVDRRDFEMGMGCSVHQRRRLPA